MNYSPKFLTTKTPSEATRFRALVGRCTLYVLPCSVLHEGGGDVSLPDILYAVMRIVTRITLHRPTRHETRMLPAAKQSLSSAAQQH